MKIINKSKKRKGFTLVETILSVFILVVISSMLVTGFITTMGYSYQTAIFSKSAAMNYSLCMEETGKWNKRSNYLDGGREEYIANKIGTLDSRTLTFVSGGDYTKCESLYVVIDKNSTLDGVVPGSLSYGDPKYAPSNSVNSFVDNRTTFYYYPEHYYDDQNNNKNTAGQVLVMIDSSDENNLVYKWVVVPKDSNPDAYTTDEGTGRTVVNWNYNIATAKNVVYLGNIVVK